jgi:hypothetical protein
MKRRFILTLVGAVVLSLLQVPRAIADQVYHSERLDFWLTDEGEAAGHPELRSGHVVNIHPNGPVNGALERYMINGATANANYQVVILAFSDLGCAGEPTLSIPTALLETTAQGNAHGQGHFSRADIDPFSGATVGVFWTLEDEDGVVAYRTDCTVVSID